MKFIRVIKASNKNYDYILKDVTKNFEKIVGFPMEKIYHSTDIDMSEHDIWKEPELDHSIWEEEFSQKALSKICKYAEEKYGIDQNDEDFIEDLVEALDNLYPY